MTSDQQPPVVPGSPWPPSPNPAVQPKKSRPTLLIVGGLVVLLLIVGGVIGLGFALKTADEKPAAPKAASAWDREQAAAPAVSPEIATTTAAPSATPAVSDIELTAKITRKKCFGSAGCNIDFKIEMGYNGPTLSEDDTWEITYEVAGVEDGPMIGSVQLTGSTYEGTVESVSTTSSKKKLKIKVTSVDKVGI